MIPAIVVLAVFGLGYGLLMLRARSRHRKACAERDGITVEGFIKEFRGTSYAHEAIETAYADLSALSRLPIRRSDDLEKTLGFLPEDFERMIENRCRALGLANVWKSSHASMFPLKTAEDYVRFLSLVMSEREQSAQK